MILLGYVSSILLAMCGIPLAWSTYKNKYSNIDRIFLTTWTIGEILGLAYVIWLVDVPLILNYTVNTICLAIVWYYIIKQKWKKK